VVRKRTGGWIPPAIGRARRDCAGDGRLAVPGARSLTENSATGNSQSGPRGGSQRRNSPSGGGRSLLRRIARPRSPGPRKTRSRRPRPRTPRPGNTSPPRSASRPRSLSRKGSPGAIPFMIASTRPVTATATACGPGEWLPNPGITQRRGRAMRSTPRCRNRRPLICPVPSCLCRVVCRCCLIRRLVRRSPICRQGARLKTVASCRAIRPVRCRLARHSRLCRLCRAVRLARPRPGRLRRRPSKWPGRRRDTSPSLRRPQARRHSRPTARIRKPRPSAHGPGSRRSRAPRSRQSRRLMPRSVSHHHLVRWQAGRRIRRPDRSSGPRPRRRARSPLLPSRKPLARTPRLHRRM